MAHIVFARKYRPQNFDNVIGQEHVTTILKNAIKLDRLSHAYLFSGPRGVGKTSTARILSKSLNCAKGPIEKPCEKCSSCIEVREARSLDTIEIDGASNRGIDEIRNLRENAQFSPVNGKYKIYIIDEVHMLTEPAFNALLKMLEEPPQHVKFIFATTQPEKIIKTITSRCQQYNFKRISTNLMSEVIKKIAKAEKLSINDDAITLIAAHADGSMRDALVLLDQVNSLGSRNITESEVASVLGLVDDDMLFRATDIILTKNQSDAFSFINDILIAGKDLELFAETLIAHFRDLMVLKSTNNTTDLIKRPKKYIEKAQETIEKLSLEDLLSYYRMLTEAQGLMKRAQTPRIPLEMFFVKSTRQRPIIQADQILQKIEEIKKKIENLPSGTTFDQVENEIPKSSYQEPQVAIPDSTSNESLNESSLNGESDVSSPVAIHSEHVATPKGTMGDLTYVKKAWPVIISHIKEKKMSVASYLQEAVVDSVDENNLIIAFSKEYSFHKETLNETENRILIEQAIKEVLKANYKVKFVTSETGVSDPDQIMPDEIIEEAPPLEEAHPVFEELDPIIESALDIFNGSIVDKKR